MRRDDRLCLGVAEGCQGQLERVDPKRISGARIIVTRAPSTRSGGARVPVYRLATGRYFAETMMQYKSTGTPISRIINNKFIWISRFSHFGRCTECSSASASE